MDNCRIHHIRFVAGVIDNGGYKPLFMPPYSPHWIILVQNQEEYKRNPLDKSDTLIPRIAEACKQVTVSDCQGWIGNSLHSMVVENKSVNEIVAKENYNIDNETIWPK